LFFSNYRKSFRFCFFVNEFKKASSGSSAVSQGATSGGSSKMVVISGSYTHKKKSVDKRDEKEINLKMSKRMSEKKTNEMCVIMKEREREEYEGSVEKIYFLFRSC
jgi:hypothetical protein